MKTWAISSGILVGAALVTAQPLQDSSGVGGIPKMGRTTMFRSAIVVAQRGPTTEKSPRNTVEPQVKSESSQTEESSSAVPLSSPTPGEKNAAPAEMPVPPALAPSKGKASSVTARLGAKIGAKRTRGQTGKPSNLDALAEEGYTSLEGEEATAAPPHAARAFIQPASAVPGANAVQDGSYSVLEDKLARLRPVNASTAEPTEVCGAVRAATGRLVAHYKQGNDQALSEETEQIRAHVCSLRNLRTLSLEQRLKVSSICRMLDDGLQLIEEGQKAGDPARIQLGLEKLHEASELLQPLGAE